MSLHRCRDEWRSVSLPDLSDMRSSAWAAVMQLCWNAAMHAAQGNGAEGGELVQLEAVAVLSLSSRLLQLAKTLVVTVGSSALFSRILYAVHKGLVRVEEAAEFVTEHVEFALVKGIDSVIVVLQFSAVALSAVLFMHYFPRPIYQALRVLALGITCLYHVVLKVYFALCGFNLEGNAVVDLYKKFWKSQGEDPDSETCLLCWVPDKPGESRGVCGKRLVTDLDLCPVHGPAVSGPFKNHWRSSPCVDCNPES